MITAPASPALIAADLKRQIAHWLASARLFRDAEEFASLQAWRSVERDMGVPLRRQINAIVEELVALGEATQQLVEAASSDATLITRATGAIQRFRRRYIQVDTTLDFLGDAINSRTSPVLCVALSTLDRLAVASMTPALQRAGKRVPEVLVYQDKGTGASILKAGVRLWVPGAVMPVAAIKIVRHNLYRPTSLFHEVGHQVAHLTGWTESGRSALEKALAGDPELAAMWAPWASEIIADLFAFLHTGYASIAALYDVVGDAETILRWPVGDPHPIGWLRAALGCEWSRQCFGGEGPWDTLQQAMMAHFPVTSAEPALRPLLERSLEAMPEIARACLGTPVPALGGAPMTAIHDPARVSPDALGTLERAAGPALWTSPHWREAEGIRIVALTGLREAENPDRSSQWIERGRSWLNRETLAA